MIRTAKGALKLDETAKADPIVSTLDAKKHAQTHEEESPHRYGADEATAAK